MNVIDLAYKIDFYIDTIKQQNKKVNLHVLISFLLDIKKELIKIDKESIRWSIEDFQKEASYFNKDQETYDPTKFQNALELMINNHDAETGITWETLRFYLNEHCLKDK